MKKIQFIGLPAMLLVLSLALIGCPTDGDGGDDTIKISTAEQLNDVRNNLGGHYVLEADIDLSGYPNWEPIGRFVAVSDKPEDAENPDITKVFSGTFDGNGHTISNVTINRPELYVGIGLFGFNYGSIRNLTVKNVDVTGYYLTGGVVGLHGGTLKNVTLNGTNTIKGSQGVGGIVGVNFGGAMSDSTATANIVILADPAYPDQSPYSGNSGGVLLGGMEGGSIVNCTASGGSVTATDVDNCLGLGGLAGNVYIGPSIINCRAENITITASGNTNKHIGGLVGYTGTYEGGPTSVSGCSVSNIIITVSNTSTQVGGLIGGCWKGITDPVPSRYRVSGCSVNDSVITGGIGSVGSIAGYAYDSIVENSTATNVTWSGGALKQIGQSETAN